MMFDYEPFVPTPVVGESSSLITQWRDELKIAVKAVGRPGHPAAKAAAQILAAYMIAFNVKSSVDTDDIKALGKSLGAELVELAVLNGVQIARSIKPAEPLQLLHARYSSVAADKLRELLDGKIPPQLRDDAFELASYGAKTVILMSQSHSTLPKALEWRDARDVAARSIGKTNDLPGDRAKNLLAALIVAATNRKDVDYNKLDEWTTAESIPLDELRQILAANYSVIALRVIESLAGVVDEQVASYVRHGVPNVADVAAEYTTAPVGRSHGD